jgi:hypothetical protein
MRSDTLAARPLPYAEPMITTSASGRAGRARRVVRAPGGDGVIVGRRRRLATVAFVLVALGAIGPFLLNEVATAAVTRTQSLVTPTTRARTPTTRARTSTTRARTTIRRRRKRSIRRVVRVARSTTTSSTRTTTTTSTTSTTVAHKPSPSNKSGARGRRTGRVGRAVATRPVSAHHSGLSTLTVILLLLGVVPLVLLGLGLVRADLAPRSSRSRRHKKSIGIPPEL